MPRPHNGRSVFIIVRTYAFAFGIWLTSDRLTSIPSTRKCGTAYSFTRKKPGLSSISSTTTLASRSGWESLQLVAGVGHFGHRAPHPVFSSSSSRRRSLVVPIFSRWIIFR